MFFFFFDELYYIPEIQQAFKNICLDKMLCDGYFDMSTYIYNRVKKADMYAVLSKRGSKYAVLYNDKMPFPKKENAATFWEDIIEKENLSGEEQQHHEEMSLEDSEAIVNWVYQVMKTRQERIEFTKALMSEIKEFYSIRHNVIFKKGVLYNLEKVDLYIFESIAPVINLIASLNTDGKRLFFRGHANANYMLRPSIMRSEKLYENENRLYNDLLVECPSDFEKCRSHLEKLVKMQHYGLPTRLLDITRNLLVGLYFACSDNKEGYGELLVLSSGQAEIKYPQSDTIAILASLPVLSYEEKQHLLRQVESPNVDTSELNFVLQHLLREVQSEKPAFVPDIKKTDLVSNYIVYANKGNSRIVKQDGAFILCGLSTEKGLLESFRFKKDAKRIVILLNKKQKILKELESCSINHATLFPEIECVAEYLKNKYSCV